MNSTKKYLTALLLGAISLVPAATATPAAAAPGSDRSAAAQAAPADDYRVGYRQGFSDGRKAAKEDCTQGASAQGDLTDKNAEWIEGYNTGYEAGFQSGFNEYCYQGGPVRR
ncbi:ABC-type sugar transport system substrate-binding protein [Actinoplanes octamycinicus]|uniref:ABC-type sugar transport system substrate-binding protein n=1 Tax=Actinoplanes octamycinicus TaxID=135948 RepID=A0A7W7H6W7_9ACTN|nr:hypothetical protein [Actinoplanes octamycinicus]MBB4744787.1 ABC-type sugar transport system substrate-binding protein [Actinoplanes octamycinicus]GIE55370.1 hypothetical protein Aoc01nite_07720 [Actinoplanes octamycinicus]